MSIDLKGRVAIVTAGEAVVPPNDSAQGMHEIGRATAHLTESREFGTTKVCARALPGGGVYLVVATEFAVQVRVRLRQGLALFKKYF